MFIDTNIFLGLYNSNNAGNVKAFMQSLFKNKSILVTTEQSFNEYLRNRTSVINELKKDFTASTANIYTSSFISSLDEYAGYSECAKELKERRKKITDRIDEILSDSNQDYIYKSFIKLWKSNNTIATDDEFIKLATKRKTLGNPPGGDKYSNCDEVIWESLVNTLNCNLIIVSRDRTYSQNTEYLQYEYNKRIAKKLRICDTVYDAFSMLKIKMDKHAIEAEDNIRWIDIIVQALEQLGVERLYLIFMRNAKI
ncbi:PIN domain-containing protein [Ruminococcaceae bacterium OttesenSCG-928-N02]|nr:PIN domain-containing protein [Ruminococcaceae bacterium OttesenSCG-928-N02]